MLYNLLQLCTDTNRENKRFNSHMGHVHNFGIKICASKGQINWARSFLYGSPTLYYFNLYKFINTRFHWKCIPAYSWITYSWLFLTHFPIPNLARNCNCSCQYWKCFRKMIFPIDPKPYKYTLQLFDVKLCFSTSPFYPHSSWILHWLHPIQHYCGGLVVEYREHLG